MNPARSTSSSAVANADDLSLSTDAFVRYVRRLKAVASIKGSAYCIQFRSWDLVNNGLMGSARYLVLPPNLRSDTSLVQFFKAGAQGYTPRYARLTARCSPTDLPVHPIGVGRSHAKFDGSRLAGTASRILTTTHANIGKTLAGISSVLGVPELPKLLLALGSDAKQRRSLEANLQKAIAGNDAMDGALGGEGGTTAYPASYSTSLKVGFNANKADNARKLAEFLLAIVDLEQLTWRAIYDSADSTLASLGKGRGGRGGKGGKSRAAAAEADDYDDLDDAAASSTIQRIHQASIEIIKNLVDSSDQRVTTLVQAANLNTKDAEGFTSGVRLPQASNHLTTLKSLAAAARGNDAGRLLEQLMSEKHAQFYLSTAIPVRGPNSLKSDWTDDKTEEAKSLVRAALDRSSNSNNPINIDELHFPTTLLACGVGEFTADPTSGCLTAVSSARPLSDLGTFRRLLLTASGVSGGAVLAFGQVFRSASAISHRLGLAGIMVPSPDTPVREMPWNFGNAPLSSEGRHVVSKKDMVSAFATSVLQNDSGDDDDECDGGDDDFVDDACSTDDAFEEEQTADYEAGELDDALAKKHEKEAKKEMAATTKKPELPPKKNKNRGGGGGKTTKRNNNAASPPAAKKSKVLDFDVYADHDDTL